MSSPQQGDRLTEREVEVLTRMANGDTYEVVARALEVSHRTASWIGQCIMRKLGAASIAHAVYLACQTGVLNVGASPTRPGEVFAYPSVRLLRSLVAEGFSISFIAGQMGMLQADLSLLMKRTSITVAMADRVTAVFQALAGRDPLVLGVHQRGYTRARNRARMSGWKVVSVGEADPDRGTNRDAA
ncbi:helix-turn-helix transcriptional regulator [Streptomyces sp. NPDC056437]|uniref:helix-turn-helix domain-containing protein n=1 Tax=Streptomyces sp. NPDC056437 TaxID=3345816 RepID=UPI0036758810